jgi:diguanylate cyclase (GGDEF)-like protein
MTDREQRLRAALTAAAEIDPLTGLLNRRSLDSRLDALVRDAADRGRPLSLVMFDLDHFKRVNDRYGHLAGDEVLRQFGRVLAAQSREDDLVARFGGEEFTAVLPGVPLADARRYAERVAAALARVGSVAGAIPMPTLSAGLASLAPGVDSVDDFLRHADSALYAAKEGGRSRLGVWGPVIEVAPPFLRPGRPAEVTQPVEVAISSPTG